MYDKAAPKLVFIDTNKKSSGDLDPIIKVRRSKNLDGKINFLDKT